MVICHDINNHLEQLTSNNPNKLTFPSQMYRERNLQHTEKIFFLQKRQHLKISSPHDQMRTWSE